MPRKKRENGTEVATPGSFAPGNNFAVGTANNKRKNPITQTLISLLNETDAATGKSKMYALGDKLLSLALAGDIDAIKYIFERVDGKVPQPVTMGVGDEDDGPYEFTLKLGQRSPDGAESVAEFRIQSAVALPEAGEGVLQSNGRAGEPGEVQPN